MKEIRLSPELAALLVNAGKQLRDKLHVYQESSATHPDAIEYLKFEVVLAASGLVGTMHGLGLLVEDE